MLKPFFLKNLTCSLRKLTKKKDLGVTKWGDISFGSTGVTVIKKMKANEETLEPEPETETEIISEEAIMSVIDEVIIEEKIIN